MQLGSNHFTEVPTAPTAQLEEIQQLKEENRRIGRKLKQAQDRIQTLEMERAKNETNHELDEVCSFSISIRRHSDQGASF